MREFSAEYLRSTRRGLWSDRSALAGLRLPERDSVLDAGCGEGDLTRVCREETPPGATVVGLDADAGLLARVAQPAVRGDATRLPFRDDSVALVVCQALLVNLPDPVAAVREFARVARDAVAVVEPDNAAVAVDSTVASEPALAERAREAYIAGVDTDVTLGRSVSSVLAEAGLEVTSEATRYHEQTVEPPYTEADLEAARRKARGTALREASAELTATLDSDAYEALVADWTGMGRAAVEQMAEGRYRRSEVVPFHVAVGQV